MKIGRNAPYYTGGRNGEYRKLYVRNHRLKNKDKYNLNRKIKRHQSGENKEYYPSNGISYTKEYKKMHRQKYKALKKNGGELTIKTIQLVYEDNIKKFGTLTCYLCLVPIGFGKDHLEHKTPLSRGGNNHYDNLAVACAKCNLKKRNKTVDEFMKGANI